MEFLLIPCHCIPSTKCFSPGACLPACHPVFWPRARKTFLFLSPLTAHSLSSHPFFDPAPAFVELLLSAKSQVTQSDLESRRALPSLIRATNLTKDWSIRVHYLCPSLPRFLFLNGAVPPTLGPKHHPPPSAARARSGGGEIERGTLSEGGRICLAPSQGGIRPWTDRSVTVWLHIGIHFEAVKISRCSYSTY